MAAMTTQEHILIVDDDAEIRNLLREYFQKNGYRVDGSGRRQGPVGGARRRRSRT